MCGREGVEWCGDCGGANTGPDRVDFLSESWEYIVSHISPNSEASHVRSETLGAMDGSNLLFDI